MGLRRGQYIGLQVWGTLLGLSLTRGEPERRSTRFRAA